MTTELRDDAFDLDALVVEDLAFAAYYPVEVAVPSPTSSPTPGGAGANPTVLPHGYPLRRTRTRLRVGTARVAVTAPPATLRIGTPYRGMVLAANVAAAHALVPQARVVVATTHAPVSMPAGAFRLGVTAPAPAMTVGVDLETLVLGAMLLDL